MDRWSVSSSSLTSLLEHLDRSGSDFSLSPEKQYLLHEDDSDLGSAGRYLHDADLEESAPYLLRQVDDGLSPPSPYHLRETSSDLTPTAQYHSHQDSSDLHGGSEYLMRESDIGLCQYLLREGGSSPTPSYLTEETTCELSPGRRYLLPEANLSRADQYLLPEDEDSELSQCEDSADRDDIIYVDTSKIGVLTRSLKWAGLKPVSFLIIYIPNIMRTSLN